MTGFQSQSVKKDDMRYDDERDGVWVGDDIFLPRNVVIWAFKTLAEQEKDDDRTNKG